MNKPFVKFVTDFGPLLIFFTFYYKNGKDLEIAIDEAKRVNANLEVTKLINEFYKDIEKIGGKRFDTSSLIKRLEP